MASKSNKAKPKTFLAGRLVFIAVPAAVATFGTLGWWLGAGEVWQRAPLAFLAGVAGFVVPVCAGVLGRSRASLVMVLPALVFMAWTAVSTEHGVETLVETPRKVEFAKANAAALDAVKAAEARVAMLQAKRDAIVPAVITCQPCLNTRKQAAKEYADALDRADKDIAAAEAAVLKAKANAPTYAPMVTSEQSLAFGGLLDLVIALGIWALEATARAEKRRAEAKAQAERKQRGRVTQRTKRQAAQPAASPFVSPEEAALLVQARGPHLRVVR